MREKIYIPQLLKMPEQKLEIILDDQISGWETLTPVTGTLNIIHRGNFLQVELSAETILTLTCDRCLQRYNHRLVVNNSEIIWLNQELNQEVNLPLEREITEEDLDETLPEDGYFVIEDWIYEQLSLAMPLRQLCGKNCQAPAENQDQDEEQNRVDNRWSSLASLKSLIKD